MWATDRITQQILQGYRRLARLAVLVHAQHAIAFAPVVDEFLDLSPTLKLHTKKKRQPRQNQTVAPAPFKQKLNAQKVFKKFKRF